ncbi:MAG: shikimate kinase [Turicibacter sp.]|nr:shikimate kinase [Turicibacter sp.]
MKPIILIGMMGSGKTTVGKQLATQLNSSWIDTDQYIENLENQSISQLFQLKGESYFRECETKALQQTLKQYDIISTGGGMIIKAQNRELLKKNAVVIYLKTQLSTLVSRIDTSNRPLLQQDDLTTKLCSLINQRKDLYQECADVTIQTDELSVNDIVKQIISYIKQNKKA